MKGDIAMRNKNSDRRLQLCRETVRQIDSRELTAAVGGYETVVRHTDGCPSPTS